MASKVSLNQQIEEAEREMGLRRKVYPALVARGKMRASEADFFVERQQAIIDTLSWLQDNEDVIKQRLA